MWLSGLEKDGFPTIVGRRDLRWDYLRGSLIVLLSNIRQHACYGQIEAGVQIGLLHSPVAV